MRLIKYISYLILICVFFYFSYILLIDKLLIKEITCSSQYGLCRDDINQALSNFRGRNYKRVKKDISDYFQNNILITNYRTQYKIPSKIIVYVIERKPIYSIKDSNNKLAIIDKDGYIIFFADNSMLPLLIIDSQLPEVGQKVNDDLNFPLDILYYMNVDFQIRNGKIGNNSLVFEYSNGIKIIFPLSGDREVLLASLNLILNQLNKSDQDSKIEKITQVKEMY